MSQPVGPKPNVIVVKVHRNQAGTSIPFDKLYFYRREDRELIPKNFGYALVLPADEPEFVKELVSLKPKKLSHFKFRRDDEALNTKIDLDGRKHTPEQIEAWWRENVIQPFDLMNRVLVIPILTSKVRKRLHPRYLSSSRWFTRQDGTSKSGGPRSKRKRNLPVAAASGLTPVSGIKPAINEMAYLATPHAAPYDKVAPICQICPRMLLHLQGECIPGQKICFKSLDFALIDNPGKQSSESHEEHTEADPEDQGDIDHQREAVDGAE